MASALVLAHASGFSWDEALLVLAPIAGVAALLFLANRRAQRLHDAPGATQDPAAGTGADDAVADDAVADDPRAVTRDSDHIP